MFSDKRGEHPAGVSRPWASSTMRASSTACCHPLYEEQWEGGEALATCFMTKLAHNCPLSFPSSALSPPCSRPVISFLLISITKVPVSSLCQSLFLSFPSPYLISQPFSVLRAQSLCYASPALAYYFTLSMHRVSPSSHPAPPPNSFPFAFSSIQAATFLQPRFSGVQGCGEDKPWALRPGKTCHLRGGPEFPCTGSCPEPILHSGQKKESKRGSAEHMKIRMFPKTFH